MTTTIAARPEGINPGRARPQIRRLYQRPLLAPNQLSKPLLVVPDHVHSGKLPSTVTLDQLGDEAARLARLGLGGVKLFAYGHDRDAHASGARAADNRMVQAVRIVKDAAPELAVTTEVCGCAWTDTSECVLRTPRGAIDLGATLALMEAMALAHAQAGADAVSPTAMLDGSIRAVRAALDHAGYPEVSVNPNLAVATSLYGPFKKVMGTDPAAGHRRGLQLDPGRVAASVRQSAVRWEAEGADALTLQPVMTHVDTLTALAAATDLPVTAYSTSGELAALDAMGAAAMIEYHLMLARAGAAHLLSFAADRVAQALQLAHREEV